MSNNSGLKTQRFNNLSRATSTPINNLQQFAASGLASALGGLLNDALALPGLDAGGWNEVKSVVDDNPLSADVISGLKVRPFSSYVLVSPGVLGTRATSASYDSSLDSEYVLVQSPGVTDSSELLFVANASASVRLDVIECSLIENSTTISEDIYNETDGTFTATLLPATFQLGLQFRIRQGTPGASYPGNVAGWLPLAVAVHPGVTASFATVAFYDVRPLVAGRVGGVGRMRLNEMAVLNNHYAFSSKANMTIGGRFTLACSLSPSALNNTNRGFYVPRGRICPTLPLDNVEDPFLDSSSGDYHQAAIPILPASGSEFRYLLAAEPANLPRWAKYTTLATASTGEREPSDNWGLYFISGDPNIAIEENGQCVSTLLPPGYGITTVNRASIVAMWQQDSAGSGGTFWPFYTSKSNFVEFTNNLTSATVPAGHVAATAFPFTVLLGRRNADGILPACASRFRVQIELTCNPTSTVHSSNITARLEDGTPISAIVTKNTGGMTSGVANTVYADFEFAIPSDAFPHGGASPYTANFELACELNLKGAGTVTATTSLINAAITGIEMGY